MTHRDRLMRQLFDSPVREHRRITFARGTAKAVTPEQLCEQATDGMEEIALGLIEPEWNARRQRPAQ